MVASSSARCTQWQRHRLLSPDSARVSRVSNPSRDRGLVGKAVSAIVRAGLALHARHARYPDLPQQPDALATAQSTALFILSHPDTVQAQRISIIIPVLNEASTIKQFLKSLSRRAGDAEIIVVDGGSSDGTVDLARDHCDQSLRSSRGRAVQMNAGASAASGNVFWFLHADTEVPADCIQQISDVLHNPEVAGGFFRIRISSSRFVYRLTDSFAHYAGLLLQMRFGDHGFFCRRGIFRKIGGFPEQPLMEDAEFFRELRRYGRVAIIPTRLISSPRRYEQIGPWRLTLTYGLIALLYFLCIPIPILARIYRKTCYAR